MNKMAAAWLIALSSASALVQAQGVSLKTTSGGDFGIQLSGHNFEADRDGAFAMSLASRRIGIVASFTQAQGNDWYWGGDALIASGSTSFSSATRGSNSANPETLTDLRLTAGRDLEIGHQVLSPYAGLGYRALSSYLKGYTTTGNVSPSRTGTLVYLPIGVTHRFRIGNDARLSTSFEYDYLLQGTQQTRYTDIVGYVSDLSNTQKKGYGARLSLAYETARWSTGVFYHYWAIQESEVGTYANTTTVFSDTEPHNITRELGIQVKYRFN